MSSLLGAEKLQGEHELSFRTSRTRFPRTENDDESSIAAYKLQSMDPRIAGRHFCSRVAKGKNDSAVFKEGTHTFGSISPNSYMQRPDQFVQGPDRGAALR